MELTTNQLLINLILSSFAYAYILRQLKVFLLKTGEPFENHNSSTPLTENQKELHSVIASIVSLGACTFIFLGQINGEYNKIFESTKSIIENILIFVLILISLYFTVINGYERYRWGKEELTSDLSHFIVFEAVAFLHYCAIPNEDGFISFLGFPHFCAAISYVGGNALLAGWRFFAYPIRIIIVLVCLALCISGKFSIIGWKI
jgi:hypothetical protein